MSTYDVLLQAIADSLKSVYMGGGQSKCFIGRQKYKSDQQKTKQKAARRKTSSRVFDRMIANVHSPDFKLLTKRQRKELTELCAQTMSPRGSDGERPQFNARDATLCAEVARHAFITQVEFNDWLNERLVTQQVVASSSVVYTEELHEALNGGGLCSMSDSEYDMVFLTFTNESFTHWAVICSLQFRSPESRMLDNEDSALWFNDLDDEGGLKRLNQISFFTILSKKWKFYSA